MNKKTKDDVSKKKVKILIPGQIKQKDIAPLREKIITENNGICPLCEYPIERPQLDHDHGSGFIRSAICGNCNLWIGKVENGLIRSGRKDRGGIMLKNLFFYINCLRPEIHPTFHPTYKKK
jgi:hypothetical protein